MKNYFNMTITFTVKEAEEHARKCEKWSRERSVIHARALTESPFWPANRVRALSDAEIAAMEWEKLNPFPTFLA